MEIYYESKREVNKFHSLYAKPSSGFHKTDFPWQERNKAQRIVWVCYEGVYGLMIGWKENPALHYASEAQVTII